MRKKRSYLPDYVTVFKDRHGKQRYRFRRVGYPSRYLPGELGSEEFLRAYAEAKAAAPKHGILQREDYPAGSIGELTTRYMAVPARLGPTLTTQAKIRAIICKFREGRETWPVAGVRFEHIDTIIAEKRIKKQVGKRIEGGVEAARRLRKELIRLFDFAKKIRMISDNPARDADRVKTSKEERSEGFYTWTETDIEQYRRYHHLGTKPRLAMELMLWTGQRRIDAIHLGRSNIVNGYIHFTQTKTDKVLGIPLAPQLLEAITAMPPHNHEYFLLSGWNRPFTNAGFGNWFREQCDAAGLPKCTAHGLRKATMRRMAELGVTNQHMKAVSGHSKDDEVARYTAAANQRRMADAAIRALSEWEAQTSNPQITKV